MKARAIVGKRVVAVRQQRVHPGSQGSHSYTHINSIVFEDGTTLTFNVAQLESEYAIEASAWKNGKKIG